MRLIGRFPNNDQVGFLVDSLRNAGFDRSDMIITDLAGKDELINTKEAHDIIAAVKTEREGIGEYKDFTDGMEGFSDDYGIVVAVKTPKHDADTVREIMEQCGAIDIIKD